LWFKALDTVRLPPFLKVVPGVLKQSIWLLCLLALFALLVLWTGLWGSLMQPVFPELGSWSYERAPLYRLVLEHASMVGLSSGLACLIGVGLGIGVTRRKGREFLPSVNAMVSVGQTFPPVAVLAVAVPAVGFGAKPTIIALFLYGLLPIVRNTIVGLENVSRDVREAARGMGMTEGQQLLQVELPLALRVIMAGVRISVIINIGTATIGATVGAGGLGAPIIAGLNIDNPVYILQGAVLSGLFAVIVDRLLDLAEQNLFRTGTS
jgi:osmoprotectant transport system permease protein